MLISRVIIAKRGDRFGRYCGLSIVYPQPGVERYTPRPPGTPTPPNPLGFLERPVATLRDSGDAYICHASVPRAGVERHTAGKFTKKRAPLRRKMYEKAYETYENVLERP